MRKMLDVVNQNGEVKEQYAVINHNNGERYSIITPRQVKHYKNLKSVEKFLNQYNLKIA